MKLFWRLDFSISFFHDLIEKTIQKQEIWQQSLDLKCIFVLLDLLIFELLISFVAQRFESSENPYSL